MKRHVITYAKSLLVWIGVILSALGTSLRSLRPSIVASIYLITIPTFAFVYWFNGSEFYQDTARFEGASYVFRESAEQMLVPVIREWLSTIGEMDDGSFVVLDEIAAVGLRGNDEGISFFTPFATRIELKQVVLDETEGPVDIKYTETSVLRWNVKLPAISDNEQDSKSVIAEVREVPTKLARSLAPPRKYALNANWGPFTGHIVFIDEENIERNNAILTGYLTIPQEAYGALMRFNLAHLGFPGGYEGGYFRFLYFSVVTITTLGYGDIVPLSDFARFLVGLESLMGIVLAGLFVNSVAATLIRERSTY